MYLISRKVEGWSTICICNNSSLLCYVVSTFKYFVEDGQADVDNSAYLHVLHYLHSYQQ